MNSAPHLLTEDRPEFERVLDEALHDETLRTAADTRAGRPHPLTVEQLRTMALNASAAISACAATEYDQYLRVRERERATRSTRAADTGQGSSPLPGGVAGAVSGAGLFPVITVLTPILAGTAALIFLLVGYVLTAMNPEPALAAPLRTAGWLFLAIAGAGVLLCTIGMVLTALRDGSSAILASQTTPPTEVTAARQAWSAALLERGIRPFLQEALASGAHTAAVPERAAEGRVPDPGRGEPRPPSAFGYSRPGFSSPGGDRSRSPGPRFSSPDFSSPDFSSPDFSSADYSDGDLRPDPGPN